MLVGGWGHLQASCCMWVGPQWVIHLSSPSLCPFTWKVGSANCRSRLLLGHFAWPSGRVGHPSVCPVSICWAAGTCVWFIQLAGAHYPRLIVPDAELLAGVPGSGTVQDQRARSSQVQLLDNYWDLGKVCGQAGNVLGCFRGALLELAWNLWCELRTGFLSWVSCKILVPLRPKGFHLTGGLWILPGENVRWVLCLRAHAQGEPWALDGQAMTQRYFNSCPFSAPPTQAENKLFILLSLSKSSAWVWENLPCTWNHVSTFFTNPHETLWGRCHFVMILQKRQWKLRALRWCAQRSHW